MNRMYYRLVRFKTKLKKISIKSSLRVNEKDFLKRNSVVASSAVEVIKILKSYIIQVYFYHFNTEFEAKNFFNKNL